MSFILYLGCIMNCSSKIDWVLTRFYRMVEWFHTKFWQVGLTKTLPPSEQDLTSLLDEADRKNKIMDSFR